MERLRAYSLAIGVGIVAAALVTFATMSPEARRARRIGSDLVAFWAAGRLVLEGEGASLYDLDAQARVQAQAIELGPGGAIPFAYPPYVAALSVPLGALPFELAWLLHLALALAATIAAALLLGVAHPALGHARGATIGCLLCLWPLWHATEIGQNTAYSLMLFAAIGAALERRGARGSAAGRGAGIASGLLAFKPTLAIFPLAMIAASRRVRALAWAGAIGVVWYALGAIVLGAAWPLAWLDALARFAALDARADLAWSVSAWAITDALIGRGGPLVAAAVAAALLAAAVRAPDDRARLALAASAAVLVPPHAGFYETALLAIPAADLVERLGRRAAPGLALAWVALAVGYFVPPGRVHLYAVPAIGVAAWHAMVVARPRAS